MQKIYVTKAEKTDLMYLPRMGSIKNTDPKYIISLGTECLSNVHSDASRIPEPVHCGTSYHLLDTEEMQVSDETHAKISGLIENALNLSYSVLLSGKSRKVQEHYLIIEPQNLETILA